MLLFPPLVSVTLFRRFDLFDTDVCIDVGINYDENGRQHGDCTDAVYDMKDVKVTPRIGGVGLMTRAMLLYNVCVDEMTGREDGRGD